MDCGIQASLSFIILQSLLKLMSTESVMPSNHIILCHPPLLLPSIFPSIRVFSSELALCIKWPKYWSFSFSISPSNEYSGMISFRIDWFDLLAVQETLKSLLQHHNLKASVLWCLAFLMVQLSYLYVTTGKPYIFCICSEDFSVEVCMSKLIWTTVGYIELAAQLCLTLCNAMDYRPPGSSVHGIIQARMLK